MGLDLPQRQRRARNPYVFRGLIYCAACNRRMQGQYNHGAAYYRCRFLQEYALANDVSHPRNVYLREETLTDPLDTWLATAFHPDHIENTITAMADAQLGDHPTPAITAARATINECDTKLRRYRAALDAGADPSIVSNWIAQTQAERTQAETELHTGTSAAPRRMTQAEITALVHALGNIVTVLRDANPADKAEVYRQIGLRLTYRPIRKRCALQSISAHTVG